MPGRFWLLRERAPREERILSIALAFERQGTNPLILANSVKYALTAPSRLPSRRANSEQSLPALGRAGGPT